MIYQTHISGWTHARLKYSFLYWFYYLLIVCLRFCQVIGNRSEYTSFSSSLFACLFRVQMFTLHFTIATFVDYFVYFFFFRSSIIDSEYILLVTYATSTTAFCLAHYKLNDMWANTREPMAVTQQKRSKHNLIYHSRTFFFSSSRFAFSIPDSKSPIVHKYRCVFFRQWFAYQLKRQSQNIVDGLPIWYDKHWNIEVINDAEALMEPVVVWNIFAWHWRELIQLTVEYALWFPVWFMYSYLLFVCRETRSLSLKWFGPISVIAMPWDSPTSSFCVM